MKHHGAIALISLLAATACSTAGSNSVNEPAVQEEKSEVSQGSYQGVQYQDSNGSSYAFHRSSGFAILESPSLRLILSNDCSALSSNDDKGTWSWANGGFIVEFPNKRIGFPRQDAPIAPPECRM